jgi:hypothetical protein
MEYKLSTAGSYTAATATEITGLAAGTYNVRYAAKEGFNAGTDAEVVVAAGANVAIGDSYGGGKVAYILQSGDPGYDANVQHGLIAATADQSTGIAWSNIASTLVGTTEIALGTGQANTTAIVGQAGFTSGAAKLCDELTEGSYSDWYLPSKDELNKLWLNKVAIGGFSDYYYWSSSEGSAYLAWVQNFSSGSQASGSKSSTARVRAVRAF